MDKPVTKMVPYNPGASYKVMVALYLSVMVWVKPRWCFKVILNERHKAKHGVPMRGIDYDLLLNRHKR